MQALTVIRPAASLFAMFLGKCIMIRRVRYIHGVIFIVVQVGNSRLDCDPLQSTVGGNIEGFVHLAWRIFSFFV